MIDPKDECAVCTNKKREDSEYCDWCYQKTLEYVPDEKEDGE